MNSEQEEWPYDGFGWDVTKMALIALAIILSMTFLALWLQ